MGRKLLKKRTIEQTFNERMLLTRKWSPEKSMAAVKIFYVAGESIQWPLIRGCSISLWLLFTGLARGMLWYKKETGSHAYISQLFFQNFNVICRSDDMHSSLLLFTVFTLLSVRVVYSGIFKISISPDYRETTQTRFKRAAAGCDDAVLMGPEKVQELAFPQAFDQLKKPWADKKVYTSPNVKTAFDDVMYKLKVPGLDTEIKDVLAYLETQGCLSVPFGGSVRDHLLGNTPGDLDMDSNCNADELFQICIDNWVCELKKPATVCSINGRRTVMHIGLEEPADTEQLDAANWENNFFGDGTGLEYTTNAIGYITNPTTGQIIIDVMGDGVDDTCNHKIGLPVIEDFWPAWFTNDKNGYNTIYRAWKLRAKGFDFKDEKIKTFLVQKAEEGFKKRTGKFKKFYCTIVLKGEYDGMASTCKIEQTKCEAALANKEMYDDFFKKDLTVDVFTTKGEPLITDYDKDCRILYINAQDDVGFFQAIWNYNY